MYAFKTIIATPEESLIKPLKGQITETGNEYTATTSIVKDLQAMPVGSKGVIYKRHVDGYFWNPVQGYENTDYYGVRPKDVLMYHAQFIKD